MKAIAWEDTVYILAEGDAISISETGLLLCPRSSQIHEVEFNITKDEEIKKRLETDTLFKQMIKPILGNIISQLLMSKDLHILDLRGSLAGAVVEVKQPATPTSNIPVTPTDGQEAIKHAKDTIKAHEKR